MKLGKLPPRKDARTLRLARYLKGGAQQIFQPPPAVDWGGRTAWPMLGNDRYGDCVEAALYHQIQAWRRNTGSSYQPSEGDVLASYSALTGFNPADPSTDNGTDILTALNYWRNTGIPVAGAPLDRIDGYASIAHERKSEVQLGVAEFGAVIVGANLPLNAKAQIELGAPWVLRPAASARASVTPGSWGGHCMAIVRYTPLFVYFVTWGRVQRASWGWFQAYVDEAYAVLSQDWINPGSDVSPSNVDVGRLRSDIAAVT